MTETEIYRTFSGNEKIYHQFHGIYRGFIPNSKQDLQLGGKKIRKEERVNTVGADS
jgi:hypothetical protein